MSQEHPRPSRPKNGAYTIAVDSGMLVLVDATNVDIFLAEIEPWCNGTLNLPDAGGVRTTHGVLVDTGGDDLFPCEIDHQGDHVHEISVTLDPSSGDGAWKDLGRLPVPSRLLLISDPAMAEQFALDPFEGPIAASTAYLVVRLPTDYLEVAVHQVASEPDTAYSSAVRCRPMSNQ